MPYRPLTASIAAHLAALRATPIKLQDGEPITRRDFQHNLLAHIFNSTERCFTNPRPGTRLLQGPSGRIGPDIVTAPVSPAGQAEGTTRRSDETPEELAAWEERNALWKRVKAKRQRIAERTKEKEEKAKEAEQAAKLAAAGADPDASTSAPAFSLSKDAGDDEAAEKDEDDIDETQWPVDGCETLTFKELYLEALVSSSRSTRTTRANVLQNPIFAEALGKACLLLNIGKFNTTLAFYPEMKTMLRSYHSIPSIQTTTMTCKNLQDTPRLKALLRGQHLANEKQAAAPATTLIAQEEAAERGGETELQEIPTTLDELVRDRYTKQHLRPPTSIVGFLFLFASVSQEIGALHFGEELDGFTLFYPEADKHVPSAERARVFLWLAWHYLEGGAALPPGSAGPNPYDDEQSRASTIEARKAWDAMSAEEQDKLREEHGRWLGVPPPANTDGDVDMSGMDPVVVASTYQRYTHRILAPKMTLVAEPLDDIENIDTPSETEFGLEMQQQRSNFVNSLVEAGQQEAGDETEDASPGPSVVAKVAKGGVAKGKKRSSTASAIAAVKKSKMPLKESSASPAPAAAPVVKREDGKSRSKGKQRQTAEQFSDEEEEEDPAVAPSAGPVTDDEMEGEDLAQQREETDRIIHALWDKPLLDPRLARPGRDSLARQAWRRILERASQGIGDASYDSDAEEQAIFEAKDQRIKPKLELARMLHCIRGTRTVVALVDRSLDRRDSL